MAQTEKSETHDLAGFESTPVENDALSHKQKDLLDKRLKQIEVTPNESESWENVKQELLNT